MLVKTFFWRAAALLVIAETIGVLFLITKKGTDQFYFEKAPEKFHLIIISTWRSGSSLVGQLFSQHPKVFYLMEPSWHIWKLLNKGSAVGLQMAVRDLLRSIFHCDMSVYDAYLPKDKKVRNLFSWKSSRALCSPPACNFFRQTDIIDQNECGKLCGRNNFSKVEEACKAYSHVVLKEVRVFNLNAIYPLMLDQSLNLRVIHLVRDPRAVFNSRGQLYRALANDNQILLNHILIDNQTEYRVMELICKSHMHIYNMAMEGLHRILKKHYMLVRYEDLARNPLPVVEEMYNFVNLDLNPTLKNWILNVTCANRSGKYNRAFATGPRNASFVSQKWRQSLPFHKVEKVQRACEKAMNTLGYQLVYSEEEQKHVSLDLLLSIQDRLEITNSLQQNKQKLKPKQD
ncbi:carbohydrate sulfotransferase 6-like [Protopterus annectens]|uniref:carbohydrate sulfotransferase 6-like n=1 Tax=Protopterus annectens TaxID=7888 RepID=UPI001CF9D7CE|nr:carbohydrate sulfotransferase 6-like [Protopterus annectens]